MPFVPLDDEDPAGCRSPDHYPPSSVRIVARVRWGCPDCGATVVLEPDAPSCTPVLSPADMALVKRPEERTRPEVRELRTRAPGGSGCCDRFAANMGCDCLARAKPCPRCGDSGYVVDPLNGRRAGVRCPHGCPVRCSVCSDPNCDNPNGQH